LLEEISRNKQIPTGFLALLLNARCDIHAVAEEGDLTARVAALTDHHWTSMQCCAELWYEAKFAAVQVGSLRDPVLDTKKAVDATGSRRRPGERPCYDHLVPNVGMNFPAVCKDGLVYVEKETGEEVVRTQLTHRLSQRSRPRKIEKH